MKFTVALIAINLVGMANAQDQSTSIVGGVQAPSGAYPWFVKLAGCGASLIHPEWALTAAHCQYSGWLNNGVRVGIEDLNDPNSGIARGVTRAIRHPNYNPDTNENDILLLKLNAPVTTVSPIPYNQNPSTSSPQENALLTVIGFGTTSFGGQSSDVLRHVDVNVVGQATCNWQYGGGIIESAMLCAGVAGGGKDSCQGDSGGPLFDQNGVQVGIVSFGTGCALANYAGVYTRVGTYANWIAQYVPQTQPAPTPTQPSPTQPTPTQPSPTPPNQPGGLSTNTFGKFSSRRRLHEVASKAFEAGDEVYHQLVADCGHFDYSLHLHIDTEAHLLVYGVPSEEAIEAGCPFGAAHSVFSTTPGGEAVTKKEILIWETVQEGLESFQEEESLSIGTFAIGDLAKAFAATTNDESGNGGVYDVITNNCATYGIKFLTALGVEIDRKMTSFVARRLIEESSKDLANKIRSSLNYFSFFGSDNRNLRSAKPSDEALVEELVSKSAGIY